MCATAFSATIRFVFRFCALSWHEYPRLPNPPRIDPAQPTAVFAVGSSRSGGVYALKWVQREFPDHFKNFVFMNARTVDAQSYAARISS